MSFFDKINDVTIVDMFKFKQITWNYMYKDIMQVYKAHWILSHKNFNS